MTIEQIIILTGIVAVVFTGVYFLHKNFKAKQLKFRRELSGQWSNERDKFKTHFIELVLNVGIDNGEITGTIASRSLKGDSLTALCSVKGKLGLRFGAITISHVRDGKVIVYGKAKIKLRRKLIHWKLQEASDFFSTKTILHKQ